MDAKRLAIGALLLVATTAHAAIEFDNPTSNGGGAGNGSLTFGTLLSGNPTVTINQIQLRMDPSDDTDATFYILQNALGGAGGSVTWLSDGYETSLFGLTSTVDQGFATGGGFFGTEAASSQFSLQDEFGSLAPAGASSGNWGGGKGAGNTINVPTGVGSINQEVNTGNGPGGGDGNGDGENGPQPPGSTAAPANAHLPEPSTLTIFGLGSMAFAWSALRRRFRRAVPA